MFRNRHLFNETLNQADQAARSLVEKRHPDWVVCGPAMLRADEGEEYILAVFYEVEGRLERPTPYQLVRVQKTGLESEEIETEPGSPYWIMGRK